MRFECVLKSKSNWSWVWVFLIQFACWSYWLLDIYGKTDFVLMSWPPVDWGWNFFFVGCALLGVVLFQDGLRKLKAAMRGEKNWALRIDEKGVSFRDALIVPWERLRSFEMRRDKSRLKNSFVNFFDDEGKRVHIVLPLGDMTPEEAEECLATIKYYVPDADAYWQDQLKNRGLA